MFIKVNMPNTGQNTAYRELVNCILELTEQLNYVLSHIEKENFSDELKEELSNMQKRIEKLENRG